MTSKTMRKVLTVTERRANFVASLASMPLDEMLRQRETLIECEGEEEDHYKAVVYRGYLTCLDAVGVFRFDLDYLDAIS